MWSGEWEKRAYIQLWHTERSEYVVYRKNIVRRKRRKKYTIVGQWPSQCTCFFFDMPRTLFSFLTLLVLSKLSISVEILFLLFAAHNRHSQNYVCAFFRKGGKRGVFLSLLFLVLIIILYYYCAGVSLSKKIFFSVIKLGERNFDFLKMSWCGEFRAVLMTIERGKI